MLMFCTDIVERPPRLTCTEIYKQGRDVRGAGKTCLTPGPCVLRYVEHAGNQQIKVKAILDRRPGQMDSGNDGLIGGKGSLVRKVW